MTLPKRIYFTGVPGSRWSGIAQILESLPGFNTSDRTSERDYSHHAYSGHKGAYFGEGMEFEANCSFTDQAWVRPESGCMIVKSHDWANDLDGIRIYRADKHSDWIMLVYRPDLTSNAWWHEAGGFKITYPNYSWYKDSATMLYEIQKQNKAILEFAYDNNLQWNRFDNQWIKDTFGLNYHGEIPAWKDILVTVYKNDINSN
jgi:hypothetical protein